MVTTDLLHLGAGIGLFQERYDLASVNRLFFIGVSSQGNPARKLQLQPVSNLGERTKALEAEMVGEERWAEIRRQHNEEGQSISVIARGPFGEI